MINKENNKMWHIDVDSNDIGQYVILPGDPFRTDLIATFLDDAKIVAHKRNFVFLHIAKLLIHSLNMLTLCNIIIVNIFGQTCRKERVKLIRRVIN